MNAPRTANLTQHSEEGKSPREHQLLHKIDDALEEARKIKEANSSRENSLAITELEVARHWAERDSELKSDG